MVASPPETVIPFFSPKHTKTQGFIQDIFCRSLSRCWIDQIPSIWVMAILATHVTALHKDYKTYPWAINRTKTLLNEPNLSLYDNQFLSSSHPHHFIRLVYHKNENASIIYFLSFMTIIFRKKAKRLGCPSPYRFLLSPVV